MRKGETFFERTIFLMIYFLKSLMPPFYSLERLDKFLRARIKKNPKAYFPLICLADLYRFYNKNEQAKEKYLEIKHLGYITDKDQLGLGEVLYRLKDYQGVIETMAPIIEKYPRDKNNNWCLAMSYFRTKDFQRAVVYFEKVIEAGSRRCEDYWHLGSCYDSLGDLDKAKNYYSKALSIKPDSKELKHNLTLIYIRIAQSLLLDKNLEKAEKEIKKAVEITPDDPKAIDGFVSLVCTYIEKKEFLRAEEICKKVIKKVGDKRKLLLCLSKIYHEFGEYSKEIEVNRRLLKIEPNNINNYIYLAALEFTYGNKLKAKEILEKALDIAKDEKEQKEIKDKLIEWFEK